MKLFSRSFPWYARKQQRTYGRMRASRIRIWISLLTLQVVVAACCYSQQPTRLEPSLQEPTLSAPFPERNMHQAPLSHVCMHFLLHQNQLDKLAAERDAQGKDGSPFRNHYQLKLKFTEAQMTVVRATGLRLESELKEIGTQAVSIAKANRAARAQAHQTAPIAPDPRLQDLTKQREETIEREVANLNRDLGPTATAKLNDVLQHHYLEHSGYRAMLRPHFPHSYPEHPQPTPAGSQPQQPVQP